MRCWGKEDTLTGESADQEDGQLAPQNNFYQGVDAKFFYQSEKEAMRK